MKLRSVKRLAFGAAVALTLSAFYAAWPRRASLREFAPAAVGKLEAGMWKDYYEHRYGALFAKLYLLNREEYRFSPLDSARLAFWAAKAAKVFQPTTSRAEAERAAPILERYYGLMGRRTGESFEAKEVAGLELDWWQLRREDVGPAKYGEVIAREGFKIYGVTNAAIRDSGLLRAEMMKYRDDRRDGKMKAEDWEKIEQELGRSYRMLKEGVTRR